LFKTVEIYLLATAGNHLVVGVFGLAGYRVFDAFRYPILARSVLDFWSRYDVCIHRWLKRNIFRPVIRRGRSPATAVLAVFAFSGAAHELLFLLALPELLGWQLAFFMLHGTGAIAAAGVGRAYQARARRRLPRSLAVASTIAFVLATTPVFLHCIDRLFDMHRDVGGLVLKVIKS
jgi:D-alanyl-lipoteichoic acid acyltransferase DltB (MBOAT superfamily)